MPRKTLTNSLPKAGGNTKTTQHQGKPLNASGKSLPHGIKPNITIDYGITTDSIGFRETVEIWDGEIGKPPTLSA